MKLETVSPDPRSLRGWTPTVACLEGWASGNEIGSKEEMMPCGCGVKLDLQDVVYPALFRAGGLALEGVEGFARRVDAHVHCGRFADAKRFLVSKERLAGESSALAAGFAAFGAQAVIELFSTSLDYFENREALQREFSTLVEQKAKLLAAAAALSRQRRGDERAVHFGKGHSIRAGGDFLLFDVLNYEAAPGYSVANNDTIITADSLLKHHSLISVFTAFNNALNDLFLMGVTEDLVLLPVYDGEEGDVNAIRSGIEAFRKYFSDRGISIEVRDQGPLRRNSKMIGATVIGSARHEVPGHTGLLPGQQILATRWLGDLSLLSLHRGLHFPLKDPHPELDRLRWGVLQRFCTANFLAAAVIRRFLPGIGEPFDPAQHVTFSSDVSGPGLFVLEEAARASGVDVYVHDMKFIDERGLAHYRKNQTSSTNGPILLSAMPAVAGRLERELRDAGYEEVWRVGHVRGRSASPTIYLNEQLKVRFAREDPRTDFFSPEVHFGSGESLKRERTPIFERMEFCAVE